MINTILEVQPREMVVEEGKSTTDIAYELAETIMEKITLKIDPKLCHPHHIEVIANLS